VIVSVPKIKETPSSLAWGFSQLWWDVRKVSPFASWGCNFCGWSFC
jgi:hypothetical protein